MVYVSNCPGRHILGLRGLLTPDRVQVAHGPGGVGWDYMVSVRFTRLGEVVLNAA